MFLYMCVQAVVRVLCHLCVRFLCGTKMFLPLRKNVYIFQVAYLKSSRRKRRRTIGKRRDRNVVGTLDETTNGISGKFRHYVNQTEKKGRHLPTSGTQTIQNVFQKYILSSARTVNSHWNLSTPHSLNLLPTVLLSQINLASESCSRAPSC